MPVSDRKLAANRANAQQSTGPRSAAGKRVSSRNACSHGLFCQHLVMFGESEQLFAAIRHDFILELAPQNTVELMLVDRIVSATWKLRRLQEAEANLLYADAHAILQIDDLEEELEKSYHKNPRPHAPRKASDMRITVSAVLAGQLNNDQGGTTERLSRYEQRLEYSIHRCMRQLRQLRKDRESEELLPTSPYLQAPEEVPDGEQDTIPPVMVTQALPQQDLPGSSKSGERHSRTHTARPLSPALSPEYREEGAELARTSKMKNEPTAQAVERYESPSADDVEGSKAARHRLPARDPRESNAGVLRLEL